MNLQHEINMFLATDFFQEFIRYEKSPFLPCMYKVKDKYLTPFGFNGAWRFWKVVKELTPEEFKPVYERIRKVPNAIKALKIATIIGLDSAQRCLWDEFVKNNLQSQGLPRQRDFIKISNIHKQ